MSAWRDKSGEEDVEQQSDGSVREVAQGVESDSDSRRIFEICEWGVLSVSIRFLDLQLLFEPKIMLNRGANVVKMSDEILW